ncbi:MAG TPA: aminoacyl--tRNA ligase-related protein, partial [Verrucomicrobiae bacterium]|nr:aminoacyl--tRNA ligase-related protein [Verrucomicrobiae bacterium]
MRQSQLFGKTRHSISQEEESVNAQLLTRGGYIDKTAAGVTSFLPLGLRVLENVKAIIRDELNKLPGTQEVLMTALQPKDLWEETGRWDHEGVKEVMYRVEDASMGLGASHEENAVDLFRKFVQSYKELPLSIYQIQTKFRKELRARSGLLRGREFQMKDMYSFHVTNEDFEQYYEETAQAYFRIFERMGLHTLRTEASGGMFSTQKSDEFQVVNPAGEDLIYLNAAGDQAWNEEVVEEGNEDKLREWGGGEIRTARSTEVGNIFRLGTKYTDAMHGEVAGEDGQQTQVIMGCYGIGVSRLVGVVTEVFGDTEKGKIAWPESLAPFKVHVIDLTQDK